MASIRTSQRRDGTVAYRVSFRVRDKVTSETFDHPDDAQHFAVLVDRIGGAAAQAKRDLASRNRPQGPVLAGVLDDYIARTHDLTEGTADDYRRILDRSGIDKALGLLPVELITDDDVHAWIAARSSTVSDQTGRKISAKTIRNEHGLLSTLLQHAVRRGWCATNVAKGLRLPKADPSDPLILTREQYKAIVGKFDKHYQPLVEFLAITGVRWGEATALQWRDVSVRTKPPRVSVRRAWKRGKAGSWRVEGLPKSGASHRTFTIPPRLLERLGKPGKPSDLVFTNTAGTVITHSNFHQRKWVRACEDAEVMEPRPTIHDLRHYFASEMLAASVPIHVVSQRLGHDDIRTTVKIYAFITPEAQRAGLDEMTALLAS